MWTWIADWWRRRRRAKSRAVFRFFDGKRTRAVDPWQAQVALETHPEFKFDMALAIDEGEHAETEIAVRAASEVFGIRRFRDDENGLTDGEIVGVLTDFMVYTTAAKKKYDRMLRSLPPTDGESSNASQKKSETGNFSTACGSASHPSKPAMPSASSVA